MPLNAITLNVIENRFNFTLKSNAIEINFSFNVFFFSILVLEKCGIENEVRL